VTFPIKIHCDTVCSGSSKCSGNNLNLIFKRKLTTDQMLKLRHAAIFFGSE